jgi:hypothetical protein
MSGAQNHVAVPLALEHLSREGGLWVREASPSMLPLIRPGDEVRLAPLDSRRITRGMLIVYLRDGRLILHRVIAFNGDGVVAKGDALVSPDPPVAWDQVVARVVALRSASGQPVDLDAFPWPLIHRVLGAVSAVTCRLSLEAGQEAAPRTLSRLAWKALRVPFHLAWRLLP